MNFSEELRRQLEVTPDDLTECVDSVCNHLSCILETGEISSIPLMISVLAIRPPEFSRRQLDFIITADFESTEEKIVVLTKIAMILLEMRVAPLAAAIHSEAWSINRIDPNCTDTPSECEDRTEIAVVSACGAFNNIDLTKCADIIRDDDGLISLGEWSKMTRSDTKVLRKLFGIYGDIAFDYLSDLFK